MKLNLDIKQSLKLAPAMVQLLQLLPLSSQELDDVIMQEVMDNPVLDMEQLYQRKMADGSLAKAQWLRQKSEPYYYQSGKTEEQLFQEPEEVQAEETSLSDYLLLQLAAFAFPPKMNHAAKYLIGCVDHNGYLTEQPEEIAELFDLSYEDACRVFSTLRSFSPPGVCAKDLRECLKLQLLPEDTLAASIVDDYLEEIALGHYAAVAKALSKNISEIYAAKERIASLSPRPSEGFSESIITQYLIPDVVVECTPQQELEVAMYRSFMPYLRISKEYLDIYKETGDEKVREYLDSKLKSAEQLINSISQREKSILACANIIVEEQRDFFLNVSQSMKPLSQAHVAHRMGVSVSTVSRITTEKYIQCSRGIIPMKQFFSREVDSTEGISADQVKENLVSLIQGENRAKPYSDQQLCDLLEQRGIRISRRTVAKYRDLLNIPGTYARKKRE